jgi:hypothetical protein
MADNSWRDKAKCKGMGWRFFIPEGPGGSLKAARAICNGDDGLAPCPVRAECKQYGEDYNCYGCWGGEVRSQRDFMRVESTPVVIEVQDSRPKRTL